MNTWLDESGVRNEYFERNDDGQWLLTSEYAGLREHYNRLLDDGKTQGEILGEYVKGSDKRALLLAMVLVEDRGLNIIDIHSRIRGVQSRHDGSHRGYSPLVGQYFFHTGDSGRAMPPRGETDSVAVRRHELASARK